MMNQQDSQDIYDKLYSFIAGTYGDDVIEGIESDFYDLWDFIAEEFDDYDVASLDDTDRALWESLDRLDLIYNLK